MKKWIIAALTVLSAAFAQAEPGFMQTVPFPAFEAWAKAAKVPGVTFAEAKKEAEQYIATFKGSGKESFILKIEGAGKFENFAGGKGSKFTWQGLEAQFADSQIDVRYTDSKASLTVGFVSPAKARSQAEMEKLLLELKPEKILKK